MQQEQARSHLIELNKEVFPTGDVRFDAERISLQGVYGDQLSAYRAKRGWVDALERCFLLEADHDYTLEARSDFGELRFSLACTFHTACARYAFWRLTNEQAPEAQYLIETAHIPDSESHQDEMITAPDLKPVAAPDPMILRGDGNLEPNQRQTPLNWIQKLIEKLS
jgi:hypothetical protein